MKTKKQILFLVPYQLRRAPGQRFRFEHYLKALEKNGYVVHIRPFLDTQTNEILYKRGNWLSKALGIITSYLKRIKDVALLQKFYAIYIFRETAPFGPPIFEWIIKKSFHGKVIYDFDDAIWISDPNENKLVSFIKNKSKVVKICRWNSMITCGNDYLATFAKKYNKNVKIIPTVINTEIYISSKSSNAIPVIGWTGSHSTLIYLESIIDTLRQLKKNYEFKFVIISNAPSSYKDNFIENVIWNEKTEVADLNRIDIGIMPLTEDPWSEGKCGLKLLQYMALEIPVIASDVGVNAKIVNDPMNGFICSSPSDWYNALEKLLVDENLRRTMGVNGRRTVVDSYSVLSTQNDFINLFN